MDIKSLQDAYYKPDLQPGAAAQILNQLDLVRWHMTEEQKKRMQEIEADVKRRFFHVLRKVPR